MKIRPTIPIVQNACTFRQKLLSHSSLRYSSLLSQTANELKSRPVNVTYDYLYPTPSHLLKVSLLDFLPVTSQQEDFNASRLPLVASCSSLEPNLLPPGHHLVYFPSAVPHRDLLPDGTDNLHSPASPTPFQRRLWAGGSLILNPSANSRLVLNGARAACIEGIRDVTITGKEGSEKLYVEIERRIGYVNADPEARLRHLDEDISEEDVIKRLWEGDEAAVVERRKLVFLKGERLLNMDRVKGKMERVIKPSQTPDLSIELTLPPSLLFRFSALTFSAHAIHLDICYSREVEGHRNLLIHGPLLLALMLSVLQSELPKGEVITSFTYRNLAPLYAQERMRVCLRRVTGDAKEWEVWIEGQSRGYAVRGSATTGMLSGASDLFHEKGVGALQFNC